MRALGCSFSATSPVDNGRRWCGYRWNTHGLLYMGMGWVTCFDRYVLPFAVSSQPSYVALAKWPT